METPEVKPVEATTKVEEPKVEPAVQPEVKTYTKDEVNQELKKQYDKLNKTLSEQGAELARLRKLQPVSDDKLYETIIKDKKAKQAETGTEDPEIRELEKTLADKRYAKQMNQQKEVAEGKRQEYYEQLKKAGIELNEAVTADLDTAIDDELYMGDGTFKRAERQLKKLLNTKKEEPKVEVKETKVTETESQLWERIEREVLEKHGLTESEKLSPSGGPSVFTTSQIKDRTFWEEHKKEIIEAQRKGLIKEG